MQDDQYSIVDFEERVLGQDRLQPMMKRIAHELVLQPAARQYAEHFVDFLNKILQKLGFMDDQGKVSFDQTMPRVEDNSRVPLADAIRDIWDMQAPTWPAIESRSNYRITMQTLLENLERCSGSRKETILSLGAGPGIYEMFLGSILSPKVSIISTDFSANMIETGKRILKLMFPARKERRPNISLKKEDMSALSFASGSVDQIICNNSLQWVPNWRQGIKEMGRVMKPNGPGCLYLTLHTISMRIVTHSDKEIRVAEHSPEDIFNALEFGNFQIERMRKITGYGTGQLGYDTQRLFVVAKYVPNRIIRSWESLQPAEDDYM